MLELFFVGLKPHASTQKQEQPQIPFGNDNQEKQRQEQIPSGMSTKRATALAHLTFGLLIA
jgi:hypothetical protein